MKFNIKRVSELRNKLSSLQDQMKEMYDKVEKRSTGLTPEERDKWNLLNDMKKTISEELDSYEAEAISAAVEADEARSMDNDNGVFTIYKKTAPKNEMRDFVLRNYDVKEEHQKITPGAFIRSMISGPKTDLEKRAVNTGTTTQGGFAVPEVLMATVMDNVRAKSHVLSSGAQTILLDSKNQKMAKIVGDPTTAWVAENGTITASDPTFASVDWSAKKLVANILASGEWMQDAIGSDSVLQRVLEGAIAAQADQVALLGAGTATEPKGIFSYTNASVYSIAPNGAALTNFDPYLELLKVLEDNNAPTPTVAIMSPRTYLAQSKLKATDNQPLQLPPALQGMRFLQTSKIPVNQTQGSSNLASSIFVGNFESLVLGLRLGMTIIPTYQNLASNYQYSFLAVMRADWQPVREQDLGVIKGVL